MKALNLSSASIVHKLYQLSGLFPLFSGFLHLTDMFYGNMFADEKVIMFYIFIFMPIIVLNYFRPSSLS